MKRVNSSPLNYSRPNGRTTDHTGTADRTLIEYKSCLNEGNKLLYIYADFDLCSARSQQKMPFS